MDDKTAPTSSAVVTTAALAKGAGGEEVMEAVKATARAATDFEWLKKGDSVFIKVAGNSPKPYPATTSPLAVLAMVELLKELGAGKVWVGDKSGVEYVLHMPDKQRGSSREVHQKNGLHAAIEESGAEPHYFEEPGYDAFFPDQTVQPGHWKGPLWLPNILKDADHVVLLPRVSRHILAGSTLGLKAAVGYLRDDSRLELHRDAATFYQKCAEINDASTLRQKLRLTLSVATKVQTTFGPDTGYQTEPDPGLVFASSSLLAHDLMALGWLMYNRSHYTPKSRLAWYFDPHKRVPHLANRFFVGWMWGLGEGWRTEMYKPSRIKVLGDDPLIKREAELMGGLPGLDLVEVSGSLGEVRDFIINKAR